MLIKQRDRTVLEARSKAEAADDLLYRDYYTRTAQIRMTAEASAELPQGEAATEVVLDAYDVARLIECALRHPSLAMRQMVLAAIWNHAESFRQILNFALTAPPSFAEIRQIVAEALDRGGAATDAAASSGTAKAEPLLPRVPLPAHLRDRDKG